MYRSYRAALTEQLANMVHPSAQGCHRDLPGDVLAYSGLGCLGCSSDLSGWNILSLFISLLDFPED